jgi:hypothetical protein
LTTRHYSQNKAELLQLKLIHLFASELLLMKKLEIEKTKSTFVISVLKVEYLVVLVSSISSFFINKMSLANKWMRKKIPSLCNLALEGFQKKKSRLLFIIIFWPKMPNSIYE